MDDTTAKARGTMTSGTTILQNLASGKGNLSLAQEVTSYHPPVAMQPPLPAVPSMAPALEPVITFCCTHWLLSGILLMTTNV
ncbi:hypothetical protein DSO57_1004127 [Entomophthora muscae]|uniref:Uncharacterized protein n=1 Tax=Entomophthora muscae TaxID=34485 RepID=A0ACC2TJB6_9FUNG|nr:hypothetical protein DSO57_1004127 [Entomophthora muscae]